MMLILAAPTPTTSASQVPWWGVPLLSGAFLLVGAIVAFLASWITKRRELERADLARWDDEIVEIGMTIVGGVEDIIDIERNGNPKYISDSKERMAMRNQVVHEMEKGRQKLRFIASTEVHRSASRVVQSLFEVINEENRDPTGFDSLGATGSELIVRIDHFIEVLRAEVRAKE